jgi:hypothetical protein
VTCPPPPPLTGPEDPRLIIWPSKGLIFILNSSDLLLSPPPGPEDPRLIVWPSKGLFMMLNSKPWPVNPDGTKPDDTQCAGPWAQLPFLIPLATYTGAEDQGAQTLCVLFGGGCVATDRQCAGSWVEGLAAAATVATYTGVRAALCKSYYQMQHKEAL